MLSALSWYLLITWYFFSGDLSLNLWITPANSSCQLMDHSPYSATASGREKDLNSPFPFPQFNVVKWELNIQTRKLPVKEGGLCVFLWSENIQLQVCGMQVHLSGIFFILTNEHTLFSFCLQMIKQSQHEFRTGNRAKPKNSLERGTRLRWLSCLKSNCSCRYSGLAGQNRVSK